MAFRDHEEDFHHPPPTSFGNIGDLVRAYGIDPDEDDENITEFDLTHNIHSDHEDLSPVSDEKSGWI